MNWIALALALVATPALAQQQSPLAEHYLSVRPMPGGGYTVTDPYDAKSLTIIEPKRGGGWTSQQPFKPGSYETATPNGSGGYNVTRPFSNR